MNRLQSRRRLVTFCAACVVGSFPLVAVAEAPVFGIIAGAEYTSGDYGGDESIDEFYVPVTGTMDFERVTLRLTVPFLSVTAPEYTVISGPDGQPIVGEGPRVTESGLGDVLMSATVYDLFTAAGGDLAIDLTGKIKFGTADADKGLGTGEQDYFLQFDAFRFFERSTLMGSLGYVVRGEPDDYELDNTWFASVGASRALNDTLRLGAFYDFRQASVPDSDALQELSAWMSTRLGDKGRAQFYVLAGFGDSSPDWGAGLSFSTSF
jgi:hypothetical protein